MPVSVNARLHCFDLDEKDDGRSDDYEIYLRRFQVLLLVIQVALIFQPHIGKDGEVVREAL